MDVVGYIFSIFVTVFYFLHLFLLLSSTLFLPFVVLTEDFIWCHFLSFCRIPIVLQKKKKNLFLWTSEMLLYADTHPLWLVFSCVLWTLITSLSFLDLPLWKSQGTKGEPLYTKEDSGLLLPWFKRFWWLLEATWTLLPPLLHVKYTLI